MKHYKILALVPALLLAACGGDEQTVNETTSPGSVVYSYPADGQADVSPKADIVLRFSHAVTDEVADLQNKILVESQGQAVAFSINRVDGGKSLKLSPTSELDQLGAYTVTFNEPLMAEGGRKIDIPNAVGDAGIQFETRGSFSGPASKTNLAEAFGIAWQVPANNSPFEVMNFSTFRMAMTHPVHPEWQALGGSIKLLDGNGDEVPTTVLVKGNRITVDPCVVEDPRECGSKNDVLDTNQTYTLQLDNLASLTSPQADRFSQEITFTPRETGPTVVMQQSAVDSGLATGSTEEDATRSVLNGQIINGVTLNSVLQGTAGPSQQTGGLFAELAYAPAFEADEALPLRIPKGSVLHSTSLDVLVGGVVPVLEATRPGDPVGDPQVTGDIKVTMLSDASGYLSPNPYTDDLNAPRHITLFMDVSMNTENGQPNAALSQDLMGVELRGIALVRDGVLTIDAIGMVEPELLGLEYTDATIAFHLEAATDADSVLDAEMLRELDSTAPSLVSWMPGPANAIPDTRQSMQRPGDPVILFFDEPIDPESLAKGLVLDANGTPLTLTDGTLKAYVDGTAVVINPVGGVQHDIDYTLNITNELTDLAGNPAASRNLSFALPGISDGSEADPASPLALTTYPGYPCATTGVDLSRNSHGQCLDDAAEGPLGQALPVTTMPEDRPIVVVFSQSMDLGSINENTFIVEKVTDASTPIGAGESVAGRIEKNNQRVRFYPETPWEVGAYYRYTMTSSREAGDCSTAICSELGYPLQTDLLVDPEDVGGPDMTIYFRGSESVNTVFTPLRNLPIRDTNSNYVIDCNTPGSTDCLEPFNHEEDGAGGFLPSANAARLRVEGKRANALGLPLGASVGCSASDEDCPKNKFIYLTFGLNTEILGPVVVNEETGQTGVRVLLYPTMLATTSASVFLTGFGEQVTGPLILRMTYGTPTEGNPQGLVEGLIIEDEQGRPRFQTTANLTLDAPNLSLPFDRLRLLSHDLYSKPFTLELGGPLVFFDDGRIQIEQRNTNVPPIDVNVEVEIPLIGGVIDLAECIADGNSLSECLSGSGTDKGDIRIPLQIPEQGVYLNFISNPVKEIPAEQ